MLKIGEFSKLSRVSIRMLRHYDEAGLLPPESIDPETGYRYYSEAQLKRINRITALRDMGFSLSAIRELLDCWEDRETVERFLRIKRDEARQELSAAGRRIQLLDTAIDWLGKDFTMKYDVTVKTFPERQIASVRRILPAYDREGELWNTLNNETAQMKLRPGDPDFACAVFHDREHKEQDVDVEVQMTVSGSYPDTENVKFRTAPAVTVASSTFNGDYIQFAAVNEAIASWIEANGYEMEGPAFAIYHVSPHEANSPDEFVTELCFPVSKK